MKLIINKENWSGEFAEIRINVAKRSLFIPEISPKPFFLKPVPKAETYHYKKFNIVHESWDSPLGFVRKFDKADKYFKAFSVGIIREAESEFVAAAQALFMTI